MTAKRPIRLKWRKPTSCSKGLCAQLIHNGTLATRRRLKDWLLRGCSVAAHDAIRRFHNPQLASAFFKLQTSQSPGTMGERFVIPSAVLTIDTDFSGHLATPLSFLGG